MYKKWMRVAALGMAVLIGCMMPVSTMMAAEEDPEAAKEIEMDSVSDDEAILDDENAGDEENVDDGIVDDENVGDEVNADEDENTGDEVNEDDENADEEISVDEDENADEEANTDNDGIAVMSEAGSVEAGDIETLASTDAPVIKITLQGRDYYHSLGGEIAYQYVNNHDQVFECSTDQENAKLSYYLDKSAGAFAAEQIDSWTEVPSASITIPLSSDAHYVLYVKAEANGKTAYARSGGIAVDTIAPNVSNLVNGGTYPEGTKFQILDTNLESVKINGTNVSSEWNTVYKVSANGTSTSCVIWAKDKAGNEMTYSITVSGKDLEENGIISESGIYSLKAGTSYQLAAGKWQVGGDKSVYSGGSTFYVKADGNYTFTKR